MFLSTKSPGDLSNHIKRDTKYIGNDVDREPVEDIDRSQM